MSRWRRHWRELCAERGSQALEAAGAALAAALIVLALLNVAPLFGATVAQAFECAASVLLGGGGDCGGGSAEVADTPGNSSTPANQPQNCGALCQVGGFFKGFGEGAWDMVVGLWDLGSDAVKAALGDEATRAKYAELWDAIRTDPGGTLLALGQAIVEPIVTDWQEGRHGEAIGRGLFEGLSVVLGPKGANKAGTLGKVDDLARAGDTLSDGRRVIRNLPCISAAPGAKGPGLAKPLEMPCSRSEYDKLRKKTPSQSIRDKVNEPEVKRDPVYGFEVDTLEADHIVPMKEIVDMPGFDELTEAEKIEVLNLEDNFMGLSKRSNTSKGARTWEQWRGHSELGPVPPEVRAEMLRREQEAREALQRAIDERRNR